jgi:hypothetical protein
MCRRLEEGRKLRVSINRSAAEAYRLLSASTRDRIAATAGTQALRMIDPDSLGALFGKDNLSAEEALRSLLAAKHVVDAEVAIRARSTRQNVH